MIIDFICEYAETLYKEGRIQEAKHEFEKALIIDPHNETARSYLQKMGFGVNEELKSPKENLNELLGQKDKSLQEKEAAITDLERRFEVTKTQLEQIQAQQNERIKSLEESLESKTKELNILNEELTPQKRS